MGWFGGKSEEPASAATRVDRQRCWESRDAYFACLDAAAVIKPGDEGKACTTENTQYEKNCAKSWIDYFNKRRVLAEQQKGILAQATNQSMEAKRR